MTEKRKAIETLSCRPDVNVIIGKSRQSGFASLHRVPPIGTKCLEMTVSGIALSASLMFTNFSVLSTREINCLVLKREGRLCGSYYYQRADGTMLTQNCPVAVRDMLRWTYRVAAGLTAALVGMSSAFAKPFPQQTSTPLTQIHPASKSLSMVFMDPSGTAVPNAKATLRQESTGNEFKAESNESGEVAFLNLPKGTYELTATYPGFVPIHVRSVKVPYSLEMHFVWSLPLMGEVVEVKEPDHQPDTVHRLFLSVKRLF